MLNSRFRTLVLAIPGLWLAFAAHAKAGYLYVSQTDNTITRIDTTTQIATTFASTGPNTVEGLAFDSAGNLYAALSNQSLGSINGTIEKYTPSGVGSVFATTAVFGYPSALAFDPAGNLYVDGPAGSNGSRAEKGTARKRGRR